MGHPIGLLLISVAAGCLGSILGLGGGVFIVPALTLAFGVDFRHAVGASLVAVIATSSGAAVSYVRERFTNVKLAVLLQVATTSGALVGVTIAALVEPDFLFLLFAILLVYSAFAMWRGRDETVASSAVTGLGPKLGLEVTNLGWGMALMGGAGLVSALLGIGSGILKVPAMDRVMRLPIKVSSATSNFMIGVTAAASAGVYFMKGDILPALAGPVALGALGGAMVGSRIMPKLPNQVIRRLFVVVLILVALQMGLRGIRGGSG